MKIIHKENIVSYRFSSFNMSQTKFCLPGEDDSLGLQVVFQALLYLIQKTVVVLKSIQQIYER